MCTYGTSYCPGRSAMLTEYDRTGDSLRRLKVSADVETGHDRAQNAARAAFKGPAAC